MSNNKFPWNCGDCPMLKTYDMSIDDLTHICLWSKNQIDDCDRYKSAECPLEKHDFELLDKVAERINYECYCKDFERPCSSSDCLHCDYGYIDSEKILKIIAEMKGEANVCS